MPEPGGVMASTTSASPVMTSGMGYTRPGSTSQPSRSAANAAYASPSAPLCG